MENFKKLVKEFHELNETEAKCYELLLLKGRITIGELCGYLELDEHSEFDTIKAICEKFVQLSLAKKIKKAGEIIDVYLGLHPFGALAKYLDQFSQELNVKLEKIQTDLKDLRTDTEKHVSDTVENIKKSCEDCISNNEENITKKNQEIDTNINSTSDKMSQQASSTIDSLISKLTLLKTNGGLTKKSSL